MMRLVSESQSQKATNFVADIGWSHNGLSIVTRCMLHSLVYNFELGT